MAKKEAAGGFGKQRPKKKKEKAAGGSGKQRQQAAVPVK